LSQAVATTQASRAGGGATVVPTPAREPGVIRDRPIDRVGPGPHAGHGPHYLPHRRKLRLRDGTRPRPGPGAAEPPALVPLPARPGIRGVRARHAAPRPALLSLLRAALRRDHDEPDP